MMYKNLWETIPIKPFSDLCHYLYSVMCVYLLLIDSCHPSLPLIATGSGQRHFAVSLTTDSDVESSDSDDDASRYDNSMKIWRMN